jgi:hypothetical protein
MTISSLAVFCRRWWAPPRRIGAHRKAGHGEPPAPRSGWIKAFIDVGFCRRMRRSAAEFRMVRSGFCLPGRLPGRARLCRMSHRSCVTVGGVVGRNLQSLGGGGSLQHRILRDLSIFFLGLPVLRPRSQTNVSITPAFYGGHKTLILLLRKLPNHDIQIGFRHLIFSPSAIRDSR